MSDEFENPSMEYNNMELLELSAYNFRSFEKLENLQLVDEQIANRVGPSNGAYRRVRGAIAYAIDPLQEYIPDSEVVRDPAGPPTRIIVRLRVEKLRSLRRAMGHLDGSRTRPEFLQEVVFERGVNERYLIDGIRMEEDIYYRRLAEFMRDMFPLKNCLKIQSQVYYGILHTTHLVRQHRENTPYEIYANHTDLEKQIEEIAERNRELVRAAALGTAENHVPSTATTPSDSRYDAPLPAPYRDEINKLLKLRTEAHARCERAMWASSVHWKMLEATTAETDTVTASAYEVRQVVRIISQAPDPGEAATKPFSTAAAESSTTEAPNADSAGDSTTTDNAPTTDTAATSDNTPEINTLSLNDNVETEAAGTNASAGSALSAQTAAEKDDTEDDEKASTDDDEKVSTDSDEDVKGVADTEKGDTEDDGDNGVDSSRSEV